VTSKTTDKKSRTNAGTFKRGRRPHNVPIKDYSSFADMVRKIADEPRKAQIAGQEVVISRSEGVYRSMVDRALRGNKRELIILLRMMMRRPSMAATFRKYHVTVVGGSLANV
jgi:hypothetical protein